MSVWLIALVFASQTALPLAAAGLERAATEPAAFGSMVRPSSESSERITPELVWSTFLGGAQELTNDSASDVATGPDGSVYVIGYTRAEDFPIVGGFDDTLSGEDDLFVARFTPEGQLAWSTFFGGSDRDTHFPPDKKAGPAIAADRNGCVYVTGVTHSNDFPTSSAFDDTFDGGSDAFVAKFDASGRLIWSTYLGGSGRYVEAGTDIAMDESGDVHVVGVTDSEDFPTTGWISRGLQGSADAFYARFSSKGQLLVSRLIGGSGNDHANGLALDAAGNVFVVGGTNSSDFPTTGVQASPCQGSMAFVSQFSPDGALLWSTYFGGSDASSAFAVAVSPGNGLYVAGGTNSEDFPTSGAFDNDFGMGTWVFGHHIEGFLARLDVGGPLRWSTYLGGTGVDSVFSIASDARGNVYVAGTTVATDFPTLHAFDPVFGDDGEPEWDYETDAFLAKFASDGTAIWSSYLGGALGEWFPAVVLYPNRRLIVVGNTSSEDFPAYQAQYPLFNGGYSDGFVSVFSIHEPPERPGNLLPTDGATGVGLSPTLVSWPFSSIAAGTTHVASQWQVSRSSEFEKLHPPAWDSGRTTSALTSLTLPQGAVYAGLTYYWRVRHQDDELYWSDWSAPTSFTTAGTPTPLIAAWPASVDTFRVPSDSREEALEIWNDGVGTLDYTVTTSPTGWLEVLPAAGQSSDARTSHTLRFNTQHLEPGSYHARILVEGNAPNSPLGIDVDITLLAAAGLHRVGAGHEYSTIQAAIDAATSGDAIVVYPGVYYEHIYIDGTDLILRSLEPQDPDIVATTVIDGEKKGSVVTFSGDETEKCRLAGFTIRNGESGAGGGIRGAGTRATIEHNVITHNTAWGRASGGSGDPYSYWWYWSGHGGGIADCDGTIRNNVISFNTSNAKGGGVAACDGLIEGNVIFGNTVKIEGRISGNGGGVYGCRAVIRGNTIDGNRAGSGGGLDYCFGTIQNNTIRDNSAEGRGGGLNDNGGRILNNLIEGNFAETGAGLASCNGSILNNTIVENEPSSGGAALEACRGRIANCIIWGDPESPGGVRLANCSLPEFSCIDGWTSGGPGNIADNPGFVEPGGLRPDFRLAAGSPCIDAGTKVAWSDWPIRDLDGNARVAGGAVDMGCYEFDSAPDTDGDLLSDADEALLGTDPDNPDTDGDGLLDGVEVRRGSDPLVPTPPGIFRVPQDIDTIQEAIWWSVAGQLIVVLPGVYRENIDFLGKDLVLRSTDPTNETVVQSTVIDGAQRGSVVTFAGTESSSCVLAGFTIRNGNAALGFSVYVGGGINGLGTQARIENNIVENNKAGRGGGLYRCDGLIQGNRIRNNVTLGYPVREGVLEDCNGTIQYNEISGNGVEDTFTIVNCGGTIRGNHIFLNHTTALYSCNGTIEENEIISNSGDGLRECSGTIRYNAVAGNRDSGFAECDGTITGNDITNNATGLMDCEAVIEGNTISSNRSSGVSGGSETVQSNRVIANGTGLEDFHGVVQGNLVAGNRLGGLIDCDGPIWNNTVVGNSPTTDGAGLEDCNGTIVNCIVWGNGLASAPVQLRGSSLPHFSCIDGWTSGGSGNINADPAFVDSAGPDGNPATHEDNDYRLGALSPCIDAGRGVHWFGWPVFDADGLARVSGPTTDIGCYEYASGTDSDGDLLSDADERSWGTDPLVADTDGDGLVDGLEWLRGGNPNGYTAPGFFRIPADWPSIRLAIEAAVPGDELVVSPGVYGENVDFQGKEIVLRGEAPTNPAMVARTIVDGNRLGPVVTFEGTERSSCTLAGLTLRNGQGGIEGHGCLATIKNAVITENQDTGISNCDGTIWNNEITNNQAVYWGGGLQDCDGTIVGNTIVNNEAVSGGGGLFNCVGTVRGNRIARNRAKGGYNDYDATGGGMLYCSGTIQNNLFLLNTSIYRGSALARCGGRIENNTVIVPPPSSGQGALYGCEGAIRNCIVRQITDPSPEYPLLVDCPNVFYSCVHDGSAVGFGNIAADPLFRNPSGPDGDPETLEDNDYRLAAGSPCIDAGDPAREFEDGLRPPGQGGPRNDMGAYGGPQNGLWLALRCDLTGALSGVEPATIALDRPIALSGYVRNQGIEPTTSPVWLEFLAIDVSTGEGVYLCDSIRLDPLGAGESFDLATLAPPRTAYSDIRPGRYAIAMRIDPIGEVAEWNEANNLVYGPTVEIARDLPNLVAVRCTFSPETIGTDGGGAIGFRGVILNNGSRPTSGSFWVEFRIWPEWDDRPPGAFLCDSLRVTAPLAPGESVSLAPLLRAAYPLPPGVYTVGVSIDPIDEIAEQNEDDNLTRIAHRRLYVGVRPSRVKAWLRYR